MLTFHNLTDSEIEYIIEHKEVPDIILSKSENVLCIFSQNWCPDWKAQERDLLANEGSSENIFVAVYIYNETKYQKEFMSVKEDVWNNALIPYLRYYKNGKFIYATNQMPFQRIVKIFNK